MCCIHKVCYAYFFFHSPCFTRDGYLAIADYDNHRIKIVKTDGTPLSIFGGKGTLEGQFKYPWAVTTTSNTALFLLVVSDSDNHRLQVLMPDGSFVRTIGQGEGDGKGQFEDPRGLCVTKSGLVGEFSTPELHG